jgi:hypothetical protein
VSGIGSSAKNAIEMTYFAFAQFRCAAHTDRAFQASSPKTFRPAGNGRAFFGLMLVKPGSGLA